MNMLISQIIGGLGNQMFQYAAVRSLSMVNNVPFRLDISGFENYSLHQGFELDRFFKCHVITATQQDVQNIIKWQSVPFFQRIFSRSGMSVLRYKRFVVEPYFHYWSEVCFIPKDSYLVGYWQSEKYFAGVTSQIRADFTFCLPMNKLNEAVATKILAVSAVSLHVRRGDYVSNAKTTATHGLCTLDYYRAAISYISKQIKNPYFFVFSDDIEWVKDNLKIDFPHQYVAHNQGAESYNDMRLMSLCQHHIIANSSFSWWGAWLNPNEEKIVIAPKRWFASPVNTEDLIPASWVRL